MFNGGLTFRIRVRRTSIGNSADVHRYETFLITPQGFYEGVECHLGSIQVNGVLDLISLINVI